jgi:hypothetical protein
MRADIRASPYLRDREYVRVIWGGQRQPDRFGIRHREAVSVGGVSTGGQRCAPPRQSGSLVAAAVGLVLVVAVVVTLVVRSGGTTPATTAPGPASQTHTAEVRLVTRAPGTGTSTCPVAVPSASAEAPLILQDRSGLCVELGPASVRFHAPTEVTVRAPQAGGSWEVVVQVSPKDFEAFRLAARAGVGHPMALVVDGRVISTPTIQPDLIQNFDGSFVLVGAFTQDDAQRLADALRLLPE